MFFSIIMPAFNSSSTISNSIESVLLQTFKDFELIIVDDSSVDDTLEIVKSINDIRIKIFSNVFCKGAAGARKTAKKFALGKYIAYLDSDDIWHSNHLQTSYDYIIKNNCSFLYSNYIANNNSDMIIYYPPRKINRRRILMSNFLPCLTVIHESCLINYEQFPVIKKRNDYYLWLKIWSLNPNLVACNTGKVTATYTVNDTGLSSNKFDAIKYAYFCLRDHTRISFIYILTHAYFTILKKFFPFIYNFLHCRQKIFK